MRRAISGRRPALRRAAVVKGPAANEVAASGRRAALGSGLQAPFRSCGAFFGFMQGGTP